VTKILMSIIVISLCTLTLCYSQDKKENGFLSNAELQQVRDRLPCLKPGITMKEAWNLLGIDIRERFVVVWGDGSRGNYRLKFQLAQDSNEHAYTLSMVMDQERKLKSVGIVCWPDHPKCKEDSQRAEENPKACPTLAPK
jgi:hypothetical protein